MLQSFMSDWVMWAVNAQLTLIDITVVLKEDGG